MNASTQPSTQPASSSTHTVRIPSFSRRARTVVTTLGTLARDPSRLDQVLVLAQTVNMPAVARAIPRIENEPGGKAIMQERPRIDRKHVDFDALKLLPDGTLGREYVRFLEDNGITPDAFEEMPDVGDERAGYMMLRMRQTHDLWHVLTGYQPDVRGEILLQAFTYSQTRAPSALLIALFGTVRWAFKWPGQRRALRDAFALGTSTAFLPTFRWEEHWATPVAELRALLTCTPAASAKPFAA